MRHPSPDVCFLVSGLAAAMCLAPGGPRYLDTEDACGGCLASRALFTSRCLAESWTLCRCGLTHPLEDEDVVQIVKQKVTTGGEEGKGRFKSTSTKGPQRIADREKKAALKT